MAGHKDLIINNRFLVYIGMNRLSFAKVSGMDDGITKETYAEGGSNHWPHVMITPMEQMRTLRFERGLQIHSVVSDKIKPGMLIPWIEVIVNDEKGPLYEYYVIGAYVTKWEIGALDAATGSVIIETFEVEHSGMQKSSLR